MTNPLGNGKSEMVITLKSSNDITMTKKKIKKKIKIKNKKNKKNKNKKNKFIKK